MTRDQMAECLSLLRSADAMLLDGGELLIAAHLSMAIETLCARARTSGYSLEMCSEH